MLYQFIRETKSYPNFSTKPTIIYTLQNVQNLAIRIEFVTAYCSTIFIGEEIYTLRPQKKNFATEKLQVFDKDEHLICELSFSGGFWTNKKVVMQADNMIEVWELKTKSRQFLFKSVIDFELSLNHQTISIYKEVIPFKWRNLLKDHIPENTTVTYSKNIENVEWKCSVLICMYELFLYNLKMS